jgi:large exoprotein involved in heme utilization and adhesion
MTKDLTLSDGGRISTSTFGQGNAGSIIINATGNIFLQGESKDGFSDGIFSQVEQTAQGDAGGIEINTKNLSLTDGALITATTFGIGDAGKVIINATGNISVDGEDKEGFRSGIFSQVDPTAEGNSAGIQISAKDLSLTNGGQISASTFGNGNAGSVIINATGNISADGETKDGSSNSGIFSEVYSTEKGDAGGIQINTKDLSLTNGGQISASTFGTGNAGRVIINATGKISADGETNNGTNSGIFSQVNSTAQGNSDGIQISTKDLFLSNGGRINASTFGDGNAGSIIINVTNLVSIDGESDIFSRAESSYEVNAGGIEINTKDLSLTNGGQISGSTFGEGNAGRVIINATGNISASGEDQQGFVSGIFSRVAENAEGNSGGIQINTKDLSLTNGGQIDASTFGKGNAGSVIINATGNISASGESIKKGLNSGIFSEVYSTEKGDAGGIQINTKDLSLINGAQISASTLGQGNAGKIIINATGNISASGESQNYYSGIFSSVESSGVGNAGGIEINTKDLSLTDGGRISASTFGNGNAGSIIINATGNISASGEDKQGLGSGIFSRAVPLGVGNAGGIKINARSLSLSNGATLTTDSQGNGAAGNIEVTTAKDIRLDNRASITANTTGGQGNIFLNSRDLILRRNSIIQTDATGTVQGGKQRLPASAAKFSRLQGILTVIQLSVISYQ